jgi:hypothetical protein
MDLLHGRNQIVVKASSALNVGESTQAMQLNAQHLAPSPAWLLQAWTLGWIAFSFPWTTSGFIFHLNKVSLKPAATQLGMVATLVLGIATEYQTMANGFLTEPLPTGDLEKTRANGDVVRYNPATEEFGIVMGKGTIRTYYKPDPTVHGKGSSMDYFNAQ